MAIPVMVMGRSGSGKTYSLKNFQKDEGGIIAVEKSRLPFRSDLKMIRIPSFDQDPELNSNARINAARYAWIQNVIQKARGKSIVIDDSQFLLVNEFFDRSEERGYNKYTDIARNFRGLIHFVNELPDAEKIVYFLHHSEPDADGREKCKTIGRMLDEKLCVEACFDIVLYCQDHVFYSQSDGMSTAKSPEGMLDIQITNDLKQVDLAIRKYYKMEV